MLSCSYGYIFIITVSYSNYIIIQITSIVFKLLGVMSDTTTPSTIYNVKTRTHTFLIHLENIKICINILFTKTGNHIYKITTFQIKQYTLIDFTTLYI